MICFFKHLFCPNSNEPRIRSKAWAVPVFILLTLGIVACDNEPSQRDSGSPSQKSSGPSLRIKMDSSAPYEYGDTLHMHIETDDSSLTISSVSIDVVGGKRGVIKSQSPHIEIPTQEIGGGQIRLRVSATFDNGESTSRYKELPMYDGFVYEGTGQYGQSKIKKWNLETGEVLLEKSIGSDYFGEGIAIFKNKLYQLTYKASQAFVYDVETFDKVETHAYATETGEGWGLTANDTSLIMSDGSSWIYYYDPASFREIKRVNVFDDKGNVDLVNELEYHNGLIYANLYTRPYIIAIDPVTGRVVESFSAAGMVDRSDATTNMDVLNGIAIQPLSGNLLVTGKYWSKVYEVRAVPMPQP